ncbi:TonB-dependent receptor [Niabella yanshanensis]|uniref:TonB-dependent receptor n=1 Tax=Niabella yanshanensis TaxID=577386 RepID=A0ABZ0WBA0_9BACT|nr:TonB-dependent receptor [Niabella yanshanensis]WQD39250.1 TonB-dependent receptor [Niabella yanshanensis]
MKLVVFIILLSSFQAIAFDAASQQRINLDVKSLSIPQIIEKIEKDYKYRFVYNPELKYSNVKLDLYARNATLDYVMQNMLKATTFSYKKINKGLVVIIGKPGEMMSISVEGKITDPAGNPLSGVSVAEKGTTNGVLSGEDGSYKITVKDENAVLTFSIVGYSAIDVSVKDNNYSQVTLYPAENKMDEVVVIGYGTAKRKDLTGAVSSVKADDIVRSPAHNAMEALQGQVPGLDIVRNSGKATSGVTMNIRGKRSLSTAKDEYGNLIANNPLVIIDGVQGGNITDIPPQEIESIDVMKDASSTAIYGSQGANGVIIVTTKRAKSGKAKISYNGYVGVNGWAQYPKMRMGEDYIKLRREAAKTTGQWSSPDDDQTLFTPEEWTAIQNNEWIDWVDQVVHNGMVQNHQVSVSGGGEKTSALLSAGYYKEKGSLKDDLLSKYNLRTAVDHSFTNVFKAGASMNLTHYAGYERAENVLWRAATNEPLGKVFDENGQLVLWPVGRSAKVNPLADEATEYTAKHQRLTTNILANGYAELKPLKGLSLRSNLGTNFSFRRNSDFEDATSIDRAQDGLAGALASVLASDKTFITWDNILSYTTKVNDHTFAFTGLTSWTQSKFRSSYSEGSGQLIPEQLWHNLEANAKSSYVIQSDYIQSQTFSYAARLNYNYLGKYLVTVSNRWDGASRLAEGHKWAAFPSAAFAWRVIDENWFENAKNLNELKFRLSWGMTGNSGISEYGTQSYLNSLSNSAFQDYGYSYYVFNPFLGNVDLGWERSAATNIGLDFGFFSNRISGSVDFYNTKTTDLLLPRTLPTSLGSGNNTPFKIYQNIGSTNNKGVEVNINTVNIRKQRFNWQSNITFAYNKEKIVDLIDGRDIIGASSRSTESLLIGRPLTSFYTFKRLGIWQLDEAEEAAKYFKDAGKTQPFKPGDIKLADLNGDFIIDETNDVQYIGTTSPRWTAGLNNTFRYKNIDLTVYILSRWGHMMTYDFTGAYDPSGKGNQPAYLDYWTPENPTNDFPRPDRTNFYNYLGYQALNYIDASYIKLKTIALGYSFPAPVVSKWGMSDLRVYASANNLFTYSRSHFVKNYDPERGGSAKSPLQRQFVLGLNVSL